MAQHDYIIENQSGAAFRADLNNGLAAIVSQNSGTNQPSTTYTYQWWADTTTGLLKIRNAANSAWITVGTLADANLGLLPSAGTLIAALGSATTPSITFTGDLNTGLWSPAADTIAASTNGEERARIDSSGRLLVGTSSARSNFFNSTVTSIIQVEGGASGEPIVSIVRNGDDIFSPHLLLAKTRGAGNVIVQNGDSVGSVTFQGSDGAEFVTVAQVLAQVDGTPGANDMPGRLVFSTTADGASSPTERMRIDTGGSIILGGGAAAANGSVTCYPNNFAGTAFLDWNRASTSTSANALRFQNDGTTVGAVTYTNTATTYSTSSDYRLKENVVPLTGAIDRVNDLQVHRFNFIADPDKTVDGFIAHEAQEIVPECVTGTKDEVDDDGNPVYQGIDQSKLVPLLTAALQESLQKIEDLEGRLTAAGL